MNYKVIEMHNSIHQDSRLGGLSFAEAEQDIPFPSRRVYCVFGVEQGGKRGFHSHKKNWQLLICTYGTIDILMDDGKSKETITLNSPTKGLILPPELWHEMIWKETGSVLCVAASEHYEPNDYIREYDEFLRMMQSRS